MLKLYGDPNDYAYKFGNDTFADELPIHVNYIVAPAYGYYHSISSDYNAHRVYYGNNFALRLETGLFVDNNIGLIKGYYYGPPETNQVTNF